MRILALLMMMVTGCAAYPFEGWDGRDTRLQAAYTALHVMDWAQTAQIARNDDYHELNPILGEHPSASEVNLFMGVSLVLFTVLPGLIQPKYRTWMTSYMCLARAAAVAHNYRIGIRF